MTHRLLLDINPNTFAALVVAGMALGGLALGIAWDCALCRFGLGAGRKGGSR